MATSQSGWRSVRFEWQQRTLPLGSLSLRFWPDMGAVCQRSLGLVDLLTAVCYTSIKLNKGSTDNTDIHQGFCGVWTFRLGPLPSTHLLFHLGLHSIRALVRPPPFYCMADVNTGFVRPVSMEDSKSELTSLHGLPGLQ